VSVRVYVPATSSLLASLVAEGRLAGPMRAHAVTDALQADWPEGDEESWEYAALMAAAAASAQLRGSGDRPRRCVVAADVPAVAPVAGEDPTLVDVAADVVWKNVAAAHLDTTDDADEDDDLAWFATQEIQHQV
jgi:ABC-type Fe3+ transport system substrate-binding protein